MFKMPANPRNTSVMMKGGKLYALSEGGKPTEMDPHTLETMDESDLGGLTVRSLMAGKSSVYFVGCHDGRAKIVIGIIRKVRQKGVRMPRACDVLRISGTWRATQLSAATCLAHHSDIFHGWHASSHETRDKFITCYAPTGLNVRHPSSRLN